MIDVQFDLTKYPIPSKLFIDGNWIDSREAQTQSLRSAVNDALITDSKTLNEGGFPRLIFLRQAYSGQMQKMSTLQLSLHPKDCELGKPWARY